MSAFENKRRKIILNKKIYFRTTSELDWEAASACISLPKEWGFDESDSSRMFKTSYFLSTFPNYFYWKKSLISYILIMLSPPPLLPDLPHSPISIPFLSLQNKTQEIHTQMPTKTQVKISKQVTNRQQTPKQCIGRQKPTESTECSVQALCSWAWPPSWRWWVHPVRLLWRKLMFPLPEDINCSWLPG